MFSLIVREKVVTQKKYSSTRCCGQRILIIEDQYKGKTMKSFICKIVCIAVLTFTTATQSTAGIKVAVVKSWGSASAFGELNSNWATYGTVPLDIDTSLMDRSSFTYQDLLNTNADVLWISDPSGNPFQYTPDEIAAVQKFQGLIRLPEYLRCIFPQYLPHRIVERIRRQQRCCY